MDSHFEKEVTAILIGSQSGTGIFVYVAARNTATSLIG